MKRTATYTTIAGYPAGWSVARGSLVGPSLVHAGFAGQIRSDLPADACKSSELGDR